METPAIIMREYMASRPYGIASPLGRRCSAPRLPQDRKPDLPEGVVHCAIPAVDMSMESRNFHDLCVHGCEAKAHPLGHVMNSDAGTEPKSCAEAEPSCDAELSACADDFVFRYDNRISIGIDT